MELSYYAHETRLTEQTMLNCIDNSGASIVECVANLRMKRHAKIGTATVPQIILLPAIFIFIATSSPCPEVFEERRRRPFIDCPAARLLSMGAVLDPWFIYVHNSTLLDIDSACFLPPAPPIPPPPLPPPPSSLTLTPPPPQATASSSSCKNSATSAKAPAPVAAAPRRKP